MLSRLLLIFVASSLFVNGVVINKDKNEKSNSQDKDKKTESIETTEKMYLSAGL